MKNKINAKKSVSKSIMKYGKWTVLPLASLSVVALPISMQVSSSQSQKKINEITFDGRAFQNVDQVINYLIDQNNLSIQNEKVAGDISTSYSDFDRGLLNKALLPDYDPKNLNFAWLKAGGDPAASYQDALDTYWNPGLFRTRYTDGFGNIFTSMEEAAKAMNSKNISPIVAMYKDVPLFGTDHKISKEPNRINPLNQIDVNKYSDNIKSNALTILENTISGKSDGGYTMEIDESKLDPTTLQTISTAKPVVDFSVEIKKELSKAFSGQHNLSIANYNTLPDGTISLESNNQMIDVPWKSSSHVYITTNDWVKNGSRSAKINWGFKKDSSTSGDTLTSNVLAKIENSKWTSISTVHADASFGFTGPDGKKTWDGSDGTVVTDFGAINLQDFLSVLNLNYASISDSNLDPALKIDADKRFNEEKVKNIFQNFNLAISDPLANLRTDIYNDFMEKDAPLFIKGNQELSKMFDDSVQKQNVLSLNNIKSEDRYKVNINAGTSYFDTEFFLDGTFDENSELQVNGVQRCGIRSLVNASAEKKFSIPSEQIGNLFGTSQNETSNKLLNYFWMWKDKTKSAPVIIKRNGHPLFSTNIAFDDQNGLVVKPNTWKNISTSTQMTSVAQNILKQMGVSGFDQDSTKETLDIIFKNISAALAIDGYKPIDDPSFNNKYTFDEALKQYLYYFKRVYLETTPLSRNLLTPKIPSSSENILYLGDASVLEFGAYRYRGHQMFNPTLSSGAVLPGDLLATTEVDKAKIVNEKLSASPTEVLAAYDTNANIINIDGYLYDDEAVLRENLINTYSPKRDFEHIYVNGKLVKNASFIIKHVSLYGQDYYFDKYDNFHRFIEEYISEKNENK